MVLGYQGGDKLKVPVESFDRIQKYASAEGARPAVMQSLKGDIEVIAPEEFASAKAVFPRPKFT